MGERWRRGSRLLDQSSSKSTVNEANQTFAVWMRGHEEALVNPLVSLLIPDFPSSNRLLCSPEVLLFHWSLADPSPSQVLFQNTWPLPPILTYASC